MNTFYQKYKKYKNKYIKSQGQIGGTFPTQNSFYILDYNIPQQRSQAIELMVRDIMFYISFNVFCTSIFSKGNDNESIYKSHMTKLPNISMGGGTLSDPYGAFMPLTNLMFGMIGKAIDEHAVYLKDIYKTVSKYLKQIDYDSGVSISIPAEYNGDDMERIMDYMEWYADKMGLGEYINKVIFKILVNKIPSAAEMRECIIHQLPDATASINFINYVGSNGNSRIVGMIQSQKQLLAKFYRFYIVNDPILVSQIYDVSKTHYKYEEYVKYYDMVKGYWRYYIYGGKNCDTPYISVLLTDNKDLAPKDEYTLKIYQEMRHVNENILYSYVRYLGIKRLSGLGTELLEYLRKYVHDTGIKYKIGVHPVMDNNPWLKTLKKYSDIINLNNDKRDEKKVPIDSLPDPTPDPIP